MRATSTAGQVAPEQLRRGAVEAVAVTVAVAGAGRLIMGPLRGLPVEDRVNTWLERRRTPALNRATWLLSTYSDTFPTILSAATVTVLRWRRNRGADAVRPVAAIALETAVFMSAAAVVGRPRPAVVWLDRPAPTSSFPSGHTGASTALHLTLADVVAESDTRTARFVASVVRFVVPPLVAWSRLYRGMHHPTDVLVGSAVGLWSYRTVRRVVVRSGAR